MKIRNLGLMVGALSAIGLSALGLSGVSCTQPHIPCTVGQGTGMPFSVQYFPKDPANDCLKLTGDQIGMATFHPPDSSGKKPDPNKTTIALQSAYLYSYTLPDDPEEPHDDASADGLGFPDLVAKIPLLAYEAGAYDTDTEHKLHSHGTYTAEVDGDDFCYASNLPAATQQIPQTDYVDENMEMQTFPATNVTYQWNNLKVYVTFAAPGTAATGEVTITRDDGTACSSTYIVNALYPNVFCGIEEPNPADPDNPQIIPDDSACCPKPDESKGRVFGSGINPDFKTKCDPNTLHCVFDWAPGQEFPPMGVNPICPD